MRVWPLKRRAQTTEITLTTDRLILRPAKISDYAAWKSVRAENYAYLKPFEPAWPPGCLAEEAFQRRVARMDHDQRHDRAHTFLIFIKSGDLIGGININNVVRGAGQYGSLGYWLAEDAQGRGYMTEAGHAVLSHAFMDLSLARMNAATLIHNRKSRAMLERLGFVEEGYAKAYIQIDGKRQDHVLYGLNAPDFLSAS